MNTRKRIAVILSGYGLLDGSEITEAVSVLIALSELGAEAVCFAPHQEITVAPDLDQSARIARTRISSLTELREKDFDAIVFPGGSGAKTPIQADVKRAIIDFHRASKPIGAICVAPVLVARVLGAEHPEVTIGDDAATAAEIEKTGARHTKCIVTDYVSDRDHKILTTPAYMFDDATPFEVFTGIRRLLRELVEMA